ncbi:MAG: hypothetical protein K8W52_27285 [Deltaproteobacteria bacterium]|nr:hypothetical protein [Deltaproteobacteria bacterium]
MTTIPTGDVHDFDFLAGSWNVLNRRLTECGVGCTTWGEFVGDHGEFYGDDEDGGRPVRVRFRWSRLGPDRAHWEQAFSPDGEAWETNWTMDFTRARS